MESLLLQIPSRPAHSEILHLPAVLMVDKFQPHHSVVEALELAAPGDAESLRSSFARKLHCHFAVRLQMKPCMDTRTAVINRNNLRAVKEVPPCDILAAQDDGNLNRKSATLPSLAHEVNRACSPPGCGVEKMGLCPRPSSIANQGLRATGRPKKKTMIVEGYWLVND